MEKEHERSLTAASNEFRSLDKEGDQEQEQEQEEGEEGEGK